MGDKTPSKGGEKAKGWSEAEKLGLLFQIIARAGHIAWDDIELPEGRTLKACKVMVDKEKQKVKKSLAEQGKELVIPKAKEKKRNLDEGDDVDDADGASKKPTPKRARKVEAETKIKAEGEDGE